MSYHQAKSGNNPLGRWTIGVPLKLGGHKPYSSIVSAFNTRAEFLTFLLKNAPCALTSRGGPLGVIDM